ncbi:MAG: DUF3987 domain-containing protein, partial [Actinomycetia bacterium]|nr:DUF3987 domain-containing protein [Actinomycetes bacterium]
MPPPDSYDPETTRRLENDFHRRCQQLGITPTQYQTWLHDPWPTPRPVATQPEPPAPFPLDTLPPWIADQAHNISTTTQTPLDLAIICQIGVISTIAMWKHARINLGGTWQEPANLYLLAVLASGEGKSPAMKQAVRPLTDLFAAELATWDTHASENYALLSTARSRLKRAERDNDKNPGEPTVLAEIAEAKTDVDRYETATERPQPIANDITPEAMLDAMAANGERLAILDTEPGIFDLVSRYAGKDQPPNITLALKAHSGDPVELRRRSTGTASLKQPYMTMLIMAQPIAVNRVYADTEMRERGLAARLLVAEPASMVGRRQQGGTVNDPAAADGWETGVRRMWHGVTGTVITLDSRAQDAFNRHFVELEQRLLPDSGDLRHVAAFTAKLKSSIGRIALLLHWADGTAGTVNRDQMTRAI